MFFNVFDKKKNLSCLQIFRFRVLGTIYNDWDDCMLNLVSDAKFGFIVLICPNDSEYVTFSVVICIF